MATREKTIIYASETAVGTIPDGTATNLAPFTVYVPESSPTFTSVFVEVGFRDVITTTGGTVGEHRVSLRLNANAYSTFTETDDITNSAESIGGVIGPIDYTSYFTSNWSGTSMTCDVQVFFLQTTGSPLGMTNVNAVLYVTYTYDDDTGTNPTQIKTVRIPLDSNTGVMSTTANANFGSANQIPILTGGSGMLPETSIVIRDYIILIEGNIGGSTATNNTTLTANIDSGGSPFAFGSEVMTLGSDVFCRYTYKPSVPTTTATHNFQLWSSIANRYSTMCAELIVTYEFNASTTTSVCNSILIPIEIASPLGNTTTSAASRFTRSIFTVEPGTITLKQSGFRLNFNTTGSPSSFLMKSGSQSYRTYTPIANVTCGQFCLQQRIDSDGVQGAGITLARGKNDFTLDAYCTNATNQVTNIMGYILLNYTSDVGSAGIGQNAHSVYKIVLAWNALLSDQNIISSYSFSIPETNYWLISTGFEFIQWVATGSNAITFDAQCLSGEGKGAGYYDVYADAYQADAERACSQVWMRGRDVFKRFPTDNVEERIDIETARNYRLFTATTTSNGMICVCSYHSFSWTVSGNISGSNGVDDIILELIRADDRLLIQTQTVAQNVTSYSFTVYNNTENYYVVGRQGNTNLGISAISTPT